jgi:hypothetical protein
VLAASLALFSTAPAGAEQADGAPPVVAFTPCETFQKDRPFSVAARFADQSELFEPKLIYRLAGGKTWKHVTFARDGELWHATVPKSELTGALEYFVEVFDENGNGPSRAGSPEQPLFARAVKRAFECPLSEDIVAPVTAEEHGAASSEPVMAETEGKQRGLLLARCRPATPTRRSIASAGFGTPRGGAALATVGIILLAAAGGEGRGYPDQVDFEVRSQALEYR